jgi:hypothetical protein
MTTYPCTKYKIPQEQARYQSIDIAEPMQPTRRNEDAQGRGEQHG